VWSGSFGARLALYRDGDMDIQAERAVDHVETPWPDPVRFEAHPFRGQVLAEVHARPTTPTQGPCRVLHFAFSTDEAAAAAARAELEVFCTARGVPGPGTAKQHRVALSGCVLRWESHSEFVTYSWTFTGADSARPFFPQPGAFSSAMDVLPQPGPLLVAVDLHMMAVLPGAGHETAAEPLGMLPSGIFNPQSLAAAEVEDGAGLIVTDFLPDPHGFVRILVLDRALTQAQAGGVVQRVLEVETYRTFALLGLVEAQRLVPSVRRIETELPGLLERMQARGPEGGDDANHQALGRLLAMAAELEAGAAGSLFRFGATRAYAELVRLQLSTIRERPVAGVPSWSLFLSRRMEPAMRTCVSMEARQANLSRKLARAGQLLRTQVEVGLQSQNRDLLHSMDRRARLQLRLQRTVEGLSVAAISYYVASLIHHVLEGVHAAAVPVDPLVGTALAVPVVVLAVAWMVRRIHRRHGLDH
jgi:uncharacterized membrane-anchored protein